MSTQPFKRSLPENSGARPHRTKQPNVAGKPKRRRNGVAVVADAQGNNDACEQRATLKPTELMKMLGRSRNWVYSKLRSGEIPAWQSGKCGGWVINRDTVLALIRKQRDPWDDPD